MNCVCCTAYNAAKQTKLSSATSQGGGLQRTPVRASQPPKNGSQPADEPADNLDHSVALSRTRADWRESEVREVDPTGRGEASAWHAHLVGHVEGRGHLHLV